MERKSLDEGGAFGVLLNDLFKVLDCLTHELHVGKPLAYGVDVPSLKLLYSYLTKRKQRMKLNDTYTVPDRKLSSGLRKAPYLDNCKLAYF